jgi:GNAT superfamily N-acetyltransferase
MKIARLDCEVDGMRTTQLIAFGDEPINGRCFLGTVELLVWKPNRVESQPRRSACIRMLFVQRAFRMQGIGRTLVEEACNISRLLGCETLGLSLARDNYSGATFYQRLGFEFSYEYDDRSLIVTKNLRESAKTVEAES